MNLLILSIEQQSHLEQHITLEEIISIVLICNPTKAPGLDGLSFQFNQSYWNIVSPYLYKKITSFYNNDLDLSKLNIASICLIPKIYDACVITNYMLSLINCSFKMIAKLLADRLVPLMDKLINSSQTTCKGTIDNG